LIYKWDHAIKKERAESKEQRAKSEELRAEGEKSYKLHVARCKLQVRGQIMKVKVKYYNDKPVY